MLFPPGSYTPSLTSHDFAPTVFPAISCDVTPVWSGVGVTGFFFGSMSLMRSPFTQSWCTPHASRALPHAARPGDARHAPGDACGLTDSSKPRATHHTSPHRRREQP